MKEDPYYELVTAINVAAFAAGLWDGKCPLTNEKRCLLVREMAREIIRLNGGVDSEAEAAVSSCGTLRVGDRFIPAGAYTSESMRTPHTVVHGSPYKQHGYALIDDRGSPLSWCPGYTWTGFDNTLDDLVPEVLEWTRLPRLDETAVVTVKEE